MAQYTSSAKTSRSFRMAISPIASQSSRVSAEPHGLCGAFSTSSRVREVTREASSSGPEPVLLPQRERDRCGPGEPGDGLIHREPGIWVDDLVAFLTGSQHQVPHDGFRTRGHDHPAWRRLEP